MTNASKVAWTAEKMTAFMVELKAKVASGDMTMDEAKEARKVIFAQVSSSLVPRAALLKATGAQS